MKKRSFMGSPCSLRSLYFLPVALSTNFKLPITEEAVFTLPPSLPVPNP